ncbi:hypothetical protein BZA05DRAFT_314154, partial [Tricharina praecox]|uniref:uncharacterized protein n=1 Tax=Tricharina praecox TaxID=43433 RepID=UPI0022207F07
AAVKTSPPRSTASPASSPEATAAEQINQPVQKRKGGRKPVYATQEERKMRNRAAQAAFRERRTEYIKHLEATIKHHEEQLSGLQQSSRNAADEVLMLRYKNSLLERILMEKGIDVTAELRAVSQYDDRPPQPQIPQATAPPPQNQPMPVQAAMSPLQQMHRPVIRRPQAPLPKRSMMSPSQDAVYIKASPDMRPIPTSRNSSPSVATMPTPPSQPYSLPPQQGNPSQQQQEFQQLPSVSSYYPSPYQTHMEELGKLPRNRNMMPSFSRTTTTMSRVPLTSSLLRTT